jgi:hypothetical protein
MPRLTKAARLIREAKSEKALWTLTRAAINELEAMEREGIVPEGTARKWHPVRTLVRISEDPNQLPSFRLFAAKEVLSYCEAPKSAQLKLDRMAEGEAPIQIQINVAPWAAQRQPALPAPEVRTGEDTPVVAHDTHDETIVEADAPVTRSGPETPYLDERARLRATANASKVTPIYEVSPDPSKQPELVGEVSQRNGYLDRDAILRRLQEGPKRND